MSKDGYIEVRLSIKGNEIELKGRSEDVRDFLNILLPIIQESQGKRGEESVEGDKADELPSIQVSEKEPVSEIILKLFSTSWAKKPRSLSEIIEALNNLGLYFQKSTVAVNLKRLVQRGKLRRLKSKDGAFLYVPIVPPGGEG
jgi:hypothetical protein